MNVYLDYAAATPLDDLVTAAMQPFFSELFYNPSAEYSQARLVNQHVQQARSLVAQHIGAKPAEIFFVAGGSEANNLVINGIMQRYKQAKLVISAIEHESVREPSQQYDHSVVNVDKKGVILIDDLRERIDDATVLLSIMYVNNEVGTIQPIKAIAQYVEKVRKERQTNGNNLPLYFHVDACQAAAYEDLHLRAKGVDLVTLNGGKIYGPKQSGAVFVRAGIELVPQIVGGGHENGLRSGTLNVANIIGFAKALDVVQSRRTKESQRLKSLQTYFIGQLEASEFLCKVNGDLKKRLPNNVHTTFFNQDNERLLYLLDEQGIMCSRGSACMASKQEPSYVLGAMGLSDEEIRASLRFSMGVATTKDNIDYAISVLRGILKK